jgi:hypothetical protein
MSSSYTEDRGVAAFVEGSRTRKKIKSLKPKFVLVGDKGNWGEYAKNEESEFVVVEDIIDVVYVSGLTGPGEEDDLSWGVTVGCEGE